MLTPDGRHVAAVVRDVAYFNVESRKKVWKALPFSHPAKLAIDHSGKKLAVKSCTGRIAILDAATGDIITDFCNKDDGEGSNLGQVQIMARTQRMDVLDEEVGGIYHCINLCERRAF